MLIHLSKQVSIEKSLLKLLPNGHRAMDTHGDENNHESCQ